MDNIFFILISLAIIAIIITGILISFLAYLHIKTITDKLSKNEDRKKYKKIRIRTEYCPGIGHCAYLLDKNKIIIKTKTAGKNYNDAVGKLLTRHHKELNIEISEVF